MNRKGFTLVEIVAVVALVAVVSAAAILAVTSVINRQRIRTATLSEKNIAEAALSIQSEKHNLYLPACMDKTSGSYVNISETILKKINDDLRRDMDSLNKVTTQQREQYIKDFVKNINTDEMFKRNFSNNYFNVKDLNCFKATSVTDMIKEGYLKDLDNGCDKASLIIIYNKGDSSNKAGNLKSVQETGICKGSESEEKGPLITVSPEQDLRSTAKKTIKVTATANESNLKSGLVLKYGWSKSLRNKPGTWETVNLVGDHTKVSAQVSKTGADEEFYLWIFAGSVKDDKGYSNTTFATGPYSFLPTPTIKYSTKYTDPTFNDPSRGHNRCNGETTCHNKTKVVVYTKPYGKNVDGNTDNLCTPVCTGYKFETWKYQELLINNNSIVGDRNNHTLIATYSPKKYTITYNSNSGNACSPNTKTVTFDEVYGSLCGTSRIGYTTVGEWWTAPSGGTQITSSTRVTTASAHTIYKHWRANVFHVAYAGNGATGGTTPTHNCTYDQPCSLRANGFSRVNYTFNGYRKDNTGTFLAVGASIKNATPIDDATVTYYAQWCRNCVSVPNGSCSLNVSTPGTCRYTTSCRTGYRLTSGSGTYNPVCTPITYTIRFNGNGANGGSTPSISCRYDQSCPLPGNGFGKTGYRFTGWATSAGGGVAYGNGASVRNLTATNGATINLYAKWTPNTYTIEFNPNGATGGGTPSRSCAFDQSCALPGNGFVKPGYTFVGWAMSPGGGVAYGNGASVRNLTATNGAKIILYAKWTPNPFTVVYYGNGNNGGATNAHNCLYDNSCPLSPNGFTKTNATFVGWKRDNVGGIYGVGADIINAVPSGQVNFYAQWTCNSGYFMIDNECVKNIYTIVFKGNGSTSGTMSKLTCGVGKNCKLKTNKFKRTGYTFAGWSTKKTGAVQYVDKATINLSPAVNSTITLYALWNCNLTVNLSHDDGIQSVSGGASGLCPNSTAEVTVSATAKNYYQVTGWKQGDTTISNSSSGKVKVSLGDSNVTIKATSRENVLYLNYRAGNTTKGYVCADPPGYCDSGKTLINITSTEYLLAGKSFEFKFYSSDHVWVAGTHGKGTFLLYKNGVMAHRCWYIGRSSSSAPVIKDQDYQYAPEWARVKYLEALGATSLKTKDVTLNFYPVYSNSVTCPTKAAWE